MKKKAFLFRVCPILEIFLLFMLLSPAWGFAQGKLGIQVMNLSDETPIVGAQITIYQGDILVLGTSNEKGNYSLDMKFQKKVNLSVTHPRFYSFDRQFEMRDDTLFLVIRLRPEKIQLLEEIVVKAPGAVDTVFSSSRLHVEDFAILPNGNMLLLTYSKQLKKGAEILLYDGQRILNSFAVPDVAEKLVQDYRGNVHVVCKERVFTLLAEESNLNLAKLEKEYFFRYIAPILDTNGMKMYYSDFDKNYPEFSYWQYDQTDSIYDKFRTIRDDLMMELYLAEYKWVDVRTKLWARNLEIETGIDAEIWVGANYFTQSLFYKELYAPFFQVKDSLLVFDYYSDKLFHHNTNGLILGSSPITHHLDKKSSGWKANLIQDQKNQNIYTWYEKAGTSYLGKIDPQTGEVNTKYQLNFKYLEKIHVFDSFVYYVFRPFETAQKKFLYKEKLPLEFTTGNQYSIVKETGK